MWVEEKPISIETRSKSNTSLDEPIVMEELERALRNGKIEASPGKDGIEYMILKGILINFKKKILEIFNIILDKGEILNQWKEYNVFFIDKPGKEKIKPISISSCVGKTFERIINDRLIW